MMLKTITRRLQLATQRQVEANRRNAQKSTGPKDTSRTRLNPTKSGLFTSATLLRSGPLKEDPKDLADLRQQLLEVLQPLNMLEDLVADDFVRAAWQLRRYCHYESRMIQLAAIGYLHPTDQLPTRERVEELSRDIKTVQAEIAATAAEEPMTVLPSLAHHLHAYLQPYLPKETASPEDADDDGQWTVYGRQILAWTCREWSAQPREIWHQVRRVLEERHDTLQASLRRLRRQTVVQETLALGLELPYHVAHRGERLRREFYATLREYKLLKSGGTDFSNVSNLLRTDADFEKRTQ